MNANFENDYEKVKRMAKAVQKEYSMSSEARRRNLGATFKLLTNLSSDLYSATVSSA